ncbi:MAG: ornithine cyclodeaminase family protein [Gammaproteobacteria bacterium]
MINLNAVEIAEALPIGRLIEALRIAFANGATVPDRAHHAVPVPNGAAGTLLLMPAWRSGKHLGVKVVTVFPDNAKQGRPAVYGSYLLMNGETGEPIALLDGTELTLRRTAAASALASTYLARTDSKSLLMVGTGNLAPHLIRAHAFARPIERVCIWGRRPEAAQQLANKLSGSSFDVEVVENLQTAVGDADIISCATLASEPLLQGKWLVDGQHIDLVGAFTPTMAEADAAAIARAAIYVDTRAGALSEAGDIVQAIKEGAFAAREIKGSLRELCTGAVSGRTRATEVTLFKSVGTALEDLAAAELATGFGGAR